MTRKQYVAKLLKIVDSIKRPADLQRKSRGHPGCLLERAHSNVSNIYTQPGRFGVSSVDIYDASDDFKNGHITKRQLRARIAALANEP